MRLQSRSHPLLGSVSILVPLAAALLLWAPAALAGGGCGGDSAVLHIFEEADQDASGDLTADEYAAAGLERFGPSFEQSDLDGDGVTTLDEYLDLYDAHHPPDDGDEV